MECWNAIPNLVNRHRYYIQNFKKIEWKLWPWQCYQFFVKYGGRDVTIYANELKHKCAHIDLLGTIIGKFNWNRPSSFDLLARTNTHTQSHTQTQKYTHIQTDNPVFSDPNKHNTFSQWKWLSVNISIYGIY